MQESFSIIMMALNLLILLMMFATIWANNKSSMEQINAIKTATCSYIDTIDDMNKKSKKALLSALVLEYKENLHWVEDTISRESEYIDESEKGRVALAKFSFEAYQANLNNATIVDSVLLDKIVQVYSAFKLFQNFLDTANTPMISGKSRATTLNNGIKQMKENLDQIKRLLREIVEYDSKS